MAALLTPPGGGTKGIVTLTDREQDRFVSGHADVREAVMSLKERWVVGLHHNWQNFEFDYDDLFDFSMAGPEELRERHGREFPLVPMDAANFCPPAFRPGGDKFWDILYVARAVFFKRIPEFFDAIRAVFDAGERPRVLLICPLPPRERGRQRTVVRDVREIYDHMFHGKEQELFNLLTIDWRYPFPFDRETLAHFYRSSRVFVHTADDERRARTAAYAWAGGLPVVATGSIAALLPPELRSEPWYWEAQAGRSFEDQILAALEFARGNPHPEFPVRRLFAAEESVAQLDQHFIDLLPRLGTRHEPGRIAAADLDIRLARHHGVGDNPNSVDQPLVDFLHYLGTAGSDELARAAAESDPERAVAASRTVPSRRTRSRARFFSRE